ncbi:MAG: ABC transporter substrate-binding protein [Acidocella sp.]|uniref:ABC transporter substrate-binding protein n=1 Tax=Acidocella sp. TaxID=50710 RepID=UPI003FBCFDBA
MSLSRRLMLGFAGACALASRAGASTVSAPAAPSAPVIGTVLPLSGNAALLGDEVLRGILLAADAVNQAGGIAGKPVSLVPTDTPDQAYATQAVGNLISGAHAKVILGSGISALSYPASAAAELAQTPFIELTALADGILTRGFKYTLRTGPSAFMVGQLAAATVQARFAGRTLGLLYNTGADDGAIAAAVTSALNAAKLPVKLAIGYPDDVADLYDQAGRLMRAKVDVLLHAAGLDDALGLALAMQAQGWRPGTLIGCGAGYQLRETQAALGPALAGTFVIGAPFYPASAAAVQEAYFAKFGTKPRSAASLTAYVGAKLVFGALNKTSGDPSKLIATLRGTNLPRGTLSNGFGVNFDLSGQNAGSFVVLQQWHGGGLVPVAT